MTLSSDICTVFFKDYRGRGKYFDRSAGPVETITVVFLMLGFCTRLTALIAAAILIIIWLLQFPVVRDFGLLSIALYLVFAWEQTCGIDGFIQPEREKYETKDNP